MSNNNHLRSDPVIPVLVPWLRGQPSRRPYVVMRRAEEHHRELLVFLQDMATKAKEANMTAPTACHAGFAHNKVMIVASSVAELEAVRDEAHQGRHCTAPVVPEGRTCEDSGHA
ncbi:hypothetical protein SNOG_03401 [Parastagonospora nodorum SN15]|uniref:Uncharacterized protein n=1 Tax=Phaeosphaeria nodorum (strain SN15 / ATCC MYA-4574 / FGSC 10173) TaxID=321614 RepID=Q0UXW3_PHANO|nr:hypothetical protein SNOG_03401 [Parastagonospora nodorum SN15]EAT88606.1 hypothetical protein SNOG_03401 [Parastagonospora nodorum SN15]